MSIIKYFLLISLLILLENCYSPHKEFWYTGMWYRTVSYMDHNVESPIFYVEIKNKRITMYSNSGIYEVFKDNTNDQILHMAFYLKKNFIAKYNMVYKGGGKVEMQYYKKRWNMEESQPSHYTFVESIVYHVKPAKKSEVKSWKDKKRIKLKSVK